MAMCGPADPDRDPLAADYQRAHKLGGVRRAASSDLADNQQLPLPSSTVGYRHQRARGAYGAARALHKYGRSKDGKFRDDIQDTVIPRP